MSDAVSPGLPEPEDPPASAAPPFVTPVGGPRSALRERSFRLLLGTQLAGGYVTPMLFLTQGWYVNTAAPEGQQVLWLGVLGAARGSAFLSYVLFGGAIADRFPRRTVTIVSQCASIGVIATIAAILAIPAVREGEGLILPMMIALFATFGVVQGQDQPTRTAMVRDAVPEHMLVNAVALFQLGLATAMIFATVVAGLAIEHLGIPQAYALAGLGPLTILLLALRLPRHVGAADPDASRTSILRNLGEGFAVLRDEPVVRWTVLLTWCSSALGLSVMGVLVAAWVRDVLGLDAAGWGLLSASWNIGSVAIMLLLATRREVRRKGRIFLGASFLFGVGVLGFSLVRSLPMAFLFNGMVGVGFMTLQAMGIAIVQTTVPNRVMGRVTGLLLLGGGLMQIMALVVGLIALVVGLERVYVGAAVAMLTITTLVTLRQPRLRALD
jgi:MFS family permease